MAPTLRWLLPALALALLSGCAALSSVTAASQRLDSYELVPLPPSGRGAGRGHLQIEPPSVSGALDTDRIAIKPNPLQVEYLPGARWVDEAGTHVQMLLARSLTNSGRFALVTTDGGRSDPAFFLLVDLEAFQAEMGPADELAVAVRVSLTLIRDEDREIIGTRNFARSMPAAEPSVAAVVPAFERAMTPLLREAVDWVVRTAR